MACNCLPAPVAERAMADCIAAFDGKVWNLGIVAGSAHSADCHPSSHNCACTCGGQESGNYDPRYAHADDFGHRVGDTETADAVTQGCLADPRNRYIIRRATLIHPDGSWSHSEGHFDHVHSSWLPGTTFDTRPFTFNVGDDAEMISKEAQDWFDKRAQEQDDRIVARVRAELFGTAKEPAGLAVLIQRNRAKLIRILRHLGLPTKD